MSVNSKMTAIADEIRTLSGETGTMGLDEMASNVAAANTEVNSQADLITQITSALEGKAVGGGGGSTVVDDVSKALIERTITEISDDRVTNIGEHAFQNCSSLTTVSFPVATSIGSYAFQYCSSLTTVSFPVATSIGSYAFQYCSSLTTVSFPAATSIGSFAFASCSNLTTVSFPAATSMGSFAFASCSNLPTASFPAATTIGGYAFFSCSSLTTVSFPAATSIGGSAFYRCINLTTASFPAAMNIGASAFYYCANLATVSFPAATSIGGYAFFGCSSLTTVSFPAVTIIGGYAFRGCSSLHTFVIANRIIPTLSNSNAFYDTSMSTTGYFYVPSSLIASYQTATNWAYFSSRFSAIEDYPGWDGVYGGSDSGDLFTFYISDVPYKAEAGMTWSEWCESKYNTLGLYDNGYNIVRNYGTLDEMYIFDQDWNDGMSGKTIIEGYNYICSV